MFIQGKHVVLKIPFEIKFFPILPRMNKYPFPVIRLAMLTSLVYRLPSECYSVRSYFDYCCEWKDVLSEAQSAQKIDVFELS